MEGDVEGVWSVLGTPRFWFWCTFCICDSPFLVLVHFLDVCPRVARPRVARPRVTRVREWRVREWRVSASGASASGTCPRVARVREWRVSASGASASGACPPVEGRGWVWRVCGRGCGRGVECAWDSALLVLVHFLYLRLSVLGSGTLSGCVSASGASASGASASGASASGG